MFKPTGKYGPDVLSLLRQFSGAHMKNSAQKNMRHKQWEQYLFDPLLIL